eukprot:2964278-Alexandrium_andersonii.AAC.1
MTLSLAWPQSHGIASFHPCFNARTSLSRGKATTLSSAILQPAARSGRSFEVQGCSRPVAP